jgi:hypothetical protein
MLSAGPVGGGEGGVGGGEGAVAVGDADGVSEDLAGAGGCVEFSDTVNTLTTSTIKATSPVPPPKMTRPRSDQRVGRCPSAALTASRSSQPEVGDCLPAMSSTLRTALRTSKSRVASRRKVRRVSLLSTMVMVREWLSSGMALKVSDTSGGRSSALTPQ